MKRWLGSLALALAAAGAAALAAPAVLPGSPARAADPGSERRGIEVTGEAVVEARPDAARITVGVQRQAATAAAAYAEAARAMNAVVAALRGKGIDQDSLRTATLALHPEYDWNREKERQELRGYRALTSVTATTRNLDQVGSLIDAAVAAGANTVDGVEFLVWEQERALGDALQRAVDNARAKAGQVAGRLGVQVGAPLEVVVLDEGATPPPVLVRAEAAVPAGAGASMPVLPGTSRLEVRVRVVFGIQ
ncbi:SIMPL domain-containing protein [Caldinitratiruptor microaerophilus]|uniref:DUF541 domain-containing protein n=1 Tax=Caldinitratiruptor microaerophilus TaxID=671077 RepID=A0AA35G7G9_9FIRM|nr:SIMPL domain-containing protein [Caldinitratiruptor microaerophilus]BDG59855.1 hypothetical protein caldi_09450 [Caldinitratiruptor microaerophilus]